MVWERSANLVPPILNPCDSGLLADHLSTYDYAVYQYFKIAVYSSENVISGIPLSGKEFHVANEARFRGKQTTANRPYELSLTSK